MSRLEDAITHGERMSRYAILEAPSILGLRPTGVEMSSTTLLQLGVGWRLGARDAGRVEAPTYSPVRDPKNGMLNAKGIADYAVTLADALEQIFARGEFPIVLGGDCSILLGGALALRRRGRYGLFFLDGHSDYWIPENEPHGEAASMDLSLVTGRGPSDVTNLEGRRPLVRVEDVIAFGMRDTEFDNDCLAQNGGFSIPTELEMITLADIRRAGFESAIARVAQFLAREELRGFWVHLDVDVLDDAVMPAVDYRMPDGLGLTELVACLQMALSSGRAIGLQVTIYNPKLDPELSAGHRLVDALVEACRLPSTV
jgi:arginase